MKVKVLGRYNLDLDTNQMARVLQHAFEGTWPAMGQARSYFHFMRSESTMRDLLREAEALEWVCNQIGNVDTVSEFFGGIGVSASIISALLKPRVHKLGDLDSECVKTLRRTYLDVYHENSLANWERYAEADFVLMDFNTFSLIHLQRGTPEGLAVRGVLTHPRPRHLCVVDTAGVKFHLNRGAYERTLGCTLDNMGAYRDQWSFDGWHRRGWVDYRNAALVWLSRDPGPYTLKFLVPPKNSS